MTSITISQRFSKHLLNRFCHLLLQTDTTHIYCNFTIGSQQSFNPFESSQPRSDNSDFDAVFGGTSSKSETIMPIGDVLTPTVANTAAPGLVTQQPQVDVTDSGKAGDLHTKLQRVAKSLGNYMNSLCLEFPTPNSFYTEFIFLTVV